MGGISIWQLLIILVIVLLIFGAKRLRNVGSDLGGAVKGFRDSMKDGEEDAKKSAQQANTAQLEEDKGKVIDVQATTQVEPKKDKDRV